VSGQTFTTDDLRAAIKVAFIVGVLAGGALSWALRTIERVILQHLADKKAELEARIRELETGRS
jgi:hypothetical protein